MLSFLLVVFIVIVLGKVILSWMLMVLVSGKVLELVILSILVVLADERVHNFAVLR